MYPAGQLLPTGAVLAPSQARKQVAGTYVPGHASDDASLGPPVPAVPPVPPAPPRAPASFPPVSFPSLHEKIATAAPIAMTARTVLSMGAPRFNYRATDENPRPLRCSPAGDRPRPD